VRDNLIIEQPHSNGVWYDVGTVDAVFVNNWVEGALIGFFFEISRGAVVAGNVFVGNESGIRILNSANARIYHNTLVNSPLLIERTERSAAGDHFGWHPRTGPDVDQRDGHVIAGNLMAATTGFAAPLLRFVQPPALCGRLTRPQAAALDANLYVRQGASSQPLIIWSPAAGDTCQQGIHTLPDLQAQVPEFEQNGRAFTEYRGALFRSPELRKFELAELPAGVRPIATVPAEIRRLLRWSEPSVPGAFPLRAARY
jgi:parallel beta-helix repeat protein